MNQNYKLLILGRIEFPFGSAAASRIRTLSKGLVEIGVPVSVLTTVSIPLRQEDLTHTGELVWEGVKYETQNTYKDYEQTLSLFQRIGNYLKANIKSCIRLYQLIKNKEIDSIMLYGRSFVSYFPFVILAKLYRISLFYDVVEWFPPEKFKGGLMNPFFYNDWLGRHLPFLGCQGIIAITTYISEKYRCHNIPTFILPSIFDYSLSKKIKFSETTNSQENFIILYSGTCKVADGFEDLLEAVKIAFSQGCPIHLHIIGTDGKSGLAAKQRRMCEKNEVLSKRVHFLGRKYEDYLSTLVNSNCLVLVLPRPDSQIARAAFPTRLPEFLWTGKPVLTTNVPDIPLYLDTDVHGEIVSGNNPNVLADGIIRLWKDPDRALRLGIAGQKRGREVFDYRHYIKRLSEFIQKT